MIDFVNDFNKRKIIYHKKVYHTAILGNQILPVFPYMKLIRKAARQLIGTAVEAQLKSTPC
ncbi:MAG: hypothetical protein ACTS73_01135 [Arsenophonus sp. NEOnobi-MAG3]